MRQKPSPDFPAATLRRRCSPTSRRKRGWGNWWWGLRYPVEVGRRSWPSTYYYITKPGFRCKTLRAVALDFWVNGSVSSSWPTDGPADGEGHVPGEVWRHSEGRSGIRVRRRLQTPPHCHSALTRPATFRQASFWSASLSSALTCCQLPVWPPPLPSVQWLNSDCV